MKELISLLDSAKSVDFDGVQRKAGVVWGPLSMNLQNLEGEDPLDLIAFVEVTSKFYPKLQLYYAKEIELFLRESQRQDIDGKLKTQDINEQLKDFRARRARLPRSERNRAEGLDPFTELMNEQAEAAMIRMRDLGTVTSESAEELIANLWEKSPRLAKSKRKKNHPS
jgi:hypothetical protein